MREKLCASRAFAEKDIDRQLGKAMPSGTGRSLVLLRWGRKRCHTADTKPVREKLCASRAFAGKDIDRQLGKAMPSGTGR